MRRTAGVFALAGLLLAGCGGGDDEPTVLSVTTPGPSATAGTATAAPGATTQLPAPNESAPTTGAPTTAAPTGVRQAYQGMGTDWQRARGVFFTAISDGRQRPIAQQRTLAGTYLRAQDEFATRLGATVWPAAARPAVTALVAVNRQQRANIAAMASAGSPSEFSAALGRYGVLTGQENGAYTAVARALG